MKRCNGERGSVLLLGIGLMTVCLLAIVLVVDAASAFLQRRALMSVADAAALAGAQAIDIAAYYRDGAAVGTRLDPARVRSAAVAQVARVPEARAIAVDGIETDGVTVRVRLSRDLDLPFWSELAQERVRVEASARLDYRSAA